MIETFNIWVYLVQVAPVAVVMGIAVVALWHRNNVLIEKIHTRDLQNLKTLESILAALLKLEEKGDTNFNALKEHITERIGMFRDEIKRA